LLLGFILFFIQFGSFGQSKRVSFTIDDLPVVSYGVLDPDFQRKLTERLISALKNNNIPAIGFVNESKLYSQDSLLLFQYQMLKSWVENGLELGNHSYSHFDYNNTSFTDFSRDIIKGEAVTKNILDDNGRSVKYFRHPYLHVGNTREKADSLDVFLAENGYSVAPVTIDNEEYIFAYAYHKAWLAKDQPMMSKIAGDYITYMEKETTLS
jgi:peptidoglycan/xylan/chitin deacetylase (PgdA/CDA1 family)